MVDERHVDVQVVRQDGGGPAGVLLEEHAVAIDHPCASGELVDDEDDPPMCRGREPAKQFADHGEELRTVAALEAVAGKQFVGQAPQILKGATDSPGSRTSFSVMASMIAWTRSRYLTWSPPSP